MDSGPKPRLTFLLDECVDARIGPQLEALGHDVTSIAHNHPRSLPDLDVLDIAQRKGRILVTSDRDFGELVFARRLPHTGVIYLRLGYGLSIATINSRLSDVLIQHADQLDQFLVVALHLVRVRR